MPPHIARRGDESFSKPFAFLHPGIGKSFQETFHQPHVFQQSVTLTARMWSEEDSKDNMENWNIRNWGVFTHYSPLLIGLFCGFGVVLLVMSTVMLWRYCLLSATKKVCCRGGYGDITNQQIKSLSPLERERNETQNGFEHFRSLPQSTETYSTLQRSATVGSIPFQHNDTRSNVKKHTKLSKLQNPNHLNNRAPSIPHLESNQFELLVSQDNLYTSHLYLQKLDTNSAKISKNLSRSTPDLEELYAKVNFSKKRKNRMRKNDAAVIAMSKSHSGQNNNSLDLSGSAIVVYNERTAL